MKKLAILVTLFFPNFILLPSIKITANSTIDSSKFITLCPDPFPKTLGNNFVTSKKVWSQGEAPIEIYSQNQAFLAVVAKQPKRFLQDVVPYLNQFARGSFLTGQRRSTKERTPT